MKDELGGKIMTEFATLRPKTYSYLTGNIDENKKTKSIKKCFLKQKLKFGNHKNFLEATHFENKINQLEKDKFGVDSPRKNHKEFIKNNKSILKSQQRFRCEKQCIYWKS